MNTILKAPGEWETVITKWTASLKAGGARPNTIRLRGHQLRQFARHNRHIALSEVLEETLITYLASGDLKASTLHSRRAGLVTFFAWCYRTGRINSNPAEKLPRITVPIGKPRPANEVDTHRARFSQDPDISLMATLAAVLGLRCCEIAAARREDIQPDFTGYSLRVTGKGGRVRVIPLPPNLDEQLLAMPPGFFFPSKTSMAGHMTAGTISKKLSQALPKGVTAHMLRHRAAAHFYHGTQYDIRATQELLGHSSVKTTQIYTPVIRSQLRIATAAAM